MSDNSAKPACAMEIPVNLPEKDAPSSQSHSHGNSGASHSHGGGGGGTHGHTHEAMENPGIFEDRDAPNTARDFSTRAFTVGIGGPVGSG
jgi:urease accessory protein